jgi:UV DNA damage endonuclease
MRLKTFKKKGIAYASELAIKNLRDLVSVVEWNNKNNVKLFRLSSSLFPWASEYRISDLPHYETIKQLLAQAGSLAMASNQRITYHPGPFDVLGSNSDSVVSKTIYDLNQHAEIMDLMGLPQNHFAPINIHINATKPDKSTVIQNFIQNFEYLDNGVKHRLVVENDDKQQQYSVYQLYHDFYALTGIPITFDYHHHYCHSDNLSEDEALALAADTWPADIVPLTHYSSSQMLYEDSSQNKPQAHADYVWNEIYTYGYNIDVELEAKAKEAALLDYRNKNKL